MMASQRPPQSIAEESSPEIEVAMETKRTRNRNGGIEAVVRDEGLPTTNTASQQQNDATEEYLDNDEGEDIEDVNEDFEGAEEEDEVEMMINREQWISKPCSPFG